MFRMIITETPAMWHWLSSGDGTDEAPESENSKKAKEKDTPLPRVLVIDDITDVRLTIELMLENMGFHVVTAASGAEGIRQLEEGAFDLVVTDILMAGVSGLDVINRLQCLHPETPVLAITGGTGAQDITGGIFSCVQKSANGMLQKPFTQKGLLAAIEAVLCPPP